MTGSMFTVTVFAADSGYAPRIVVRAQEDGDLVASLPLDDNLGETLPDWDMELVTQEAGVATFTGVPSTGMGWMKLWVAATETAAQDDEAPLSAFATAAASWVEVNPPSFHRMLITSAVRDLGWRDPALRPQLHAALEVLTRAIGPRKLAKLVSEMRCQALNAIERGCERPDEVARIVRQVTREVEA